MTSASVFQSCLQLLCEILIDGCWTCAVEKHEDFKFLFHVVLSPLSFGALEFSGEKIIHHQRGDKCGDAKILLRIVIEHVEPELIAAAGQPGEQLVHPELVLIRPLTDGVQ